MSNRDRMLAMFAAIGSAHVGEPLTAESLLERLHSDPEFMRRFNGSMPGVVKFPDAETARLAAAFDSAAVRLP